MDEKNSKYKMEKTDLKDIDGNPLFRIVAKKDLKWARKGEKGGLINSEKNLDISGDAWVSGNARVSGDAWVSGNARVSGDAWVSGNAQVSGDAWVSGNAQVSGDAWVSGNARVSGDAWVSGDARVYGNARVSGDAWVSGGFDLSVNIDFELKRIRVDSKEKLDKLKEFLDLF
jgi:cytoskeletal protein CcmA (bactofilin family)